MPAVFNDNMVLQQDMPIKFWGTAEPQAEIKIQFADLEANAKADSKGLWSLYFPKQICSKENRILKVFENDKLAKEFKNVLVGEVWILGGQSNMDWAVSTTADYGKLLESKSKYSNLRIYLGATTHSLKPEFKTNKGAHWENISEENDIAKYPSTGIYFAEALLKNLDVPIGVLRLCQSGTPMFVWIPENAQRNAPFLEKTLSDWQKRIDSYDVNEELKRWKIAKEKWEADAEKLKAEGKKVPPMPNSLTSEPKKEPYFRCLYPGWLYNGRVAPVAGFTARGIVWYQGEGDCTKERQPYFEENFTLLISEWRKAWGKEDLPFIFVQLAAHEYHYDWALTRWKQYLAYKHIKNTQIAIIPDMGEEKEIHFPAKKALSQRLCDIALSKVYNKNLQAYGPFFKAVKIDANSATLTFEDFGQGVIVKSGKDAENLSGFEVKLEDSTWVLAKAKLEGENIKIYSDKKFTAVRYLWKNWCLPDVSIVNKDGLPLAPFTTE